MAEPTAIDSALGVALLLAGLSVVGVGLSGYGLALWLAGPTPTSRWRTMGRAVLGQSTTCLLTFGFLLCTAGTEAALGAPLGPGYSGGGSLVAWFLGARFALLDHAVNTALFRQLDARDSPVDALLAGSTATLGVAASIAATAFGWAAAMVAFAALVIDG